MIKNFMKKQYYNIRDLFKNRTDFFAIIILLTLFLLNILKISLSNYFIIPEPTYEILKYKIKITFFILLLIYPIFLIFRSRILFAILYVIQIFYLLTNISYYSYFYSYVQIGHLLALLSEGFTTASNYSVPFDKRLLIVFIDLPIFILFLKYFKNIYKIKSKFAFYIVLTMIISLFSVTNLEIKNYAKGKSIIQYKKSDFWGETPVVERYGPFINSLANFYKFNNEKALIEKFTYGGEIGAIVEDEKVEEKPNFIILQLESIDTSIIEQKYNDEFVAPYLNSLRYNSVYYPYMLSFHKGGGTSDIEFSIINSVEPLDSFPSIKLSSYDYSNSMLRSLNEGGYKTLAFHGNEGKFYNRNVALPKMGYQEFFDMKKMKLKHNGWGASDEDVLKFSLDKMKNTKRPFFSYIITMTSHGPFTNARKYYNNTNYNTIQDEMIRDYFNSVSYVDKVIENTVKEIKNNFENTYIFIFGDHTPNIGNEIYTQSSEMVNKKHLEFVPLFIITPNNDRYYEKREIVSNLDITASILFNSKTSFNIYSDGEDLLKKNSFKKKIKYLNEVFDRDYLYNLLDKKLTKS